jgi:hypothetical protein
VRAVVALLSALLGIGAAAAPMPPAARAEIDDLLARLEKSACRFNRGGTWYSGAEAKAHLLRKLKYMEDRGMIQTTEQFIERAASSSSITGEPYLVKCADALPVKSGLWLAAELQAIRSSGADRHQGTTGGRAPRTLGRPRRRAIDYE